MKQTDENVDDIQEKMQSTYSENPLNALSLLAASALKKKVHRVVNDDNQLIEVREGDLQYNNALKDGLFNKHSYTFRVKGRGTLQSILPPLVEAIAIELRVMIVVVHTCFDKFC